MSGRSTLEPAPSAEPVPRREVAPLVPGTLYLVATPIGNLEDITLRASRVLKECSVIAAEDTRHTSRLLQHLGLRKPLMSCHQFNEARRGDEFIERLRAGQTVALVSDAGSPGISDPGERLVRKVVEAGLRVESVPGACALIAALSASALPTGEFHFFGFPPHKGAARRKFLARAGSHEGTIVFYESPHRLLKMLEDIAALWPDRHVVLARELTKKFEEFQRGTASELVLLNASRAVRGEFVVLLEPLGREAKREPEFSASPVGSLNPEIFPGSEDSSGPGPT